MEPITNTAQLLVLPTTMCLLSEDGRDLELQAEFTYDPTDPYAVSLSTSADDRPIVWTFARDLLSQGLAEPTGEGDVHVFPGALEEGTQTILVDLSSNDGKALLAADRTHIEAFVTMSHEMVTPGSERDHLDIDAAIALILQTLAGGDCDD